MCCFAGINGAFGQESRSCKRINEEKKERWWRE
jgi:hypothetical protein